MEHSAWVPQEGFLILSFERIMMTGALQSQLSRCIEFDGCIIYNAKRIIGFVPFIVRVLHTERRRRYVTRYITIILSP